MQWPIFAKSQMNKYSSYCLPSFECYALQVSILLNSSFLKNGFGYLNFSFLFWRLRFLTTNELNIFPFFSWLSIDQILIFHNSNFALCTTTEI